MKKKIDTRPPEQLKLVTGIMRILGNRPVDSGHINAIVKAADSIVAEFKRVRVYSSPAMGFAKWIRSDDTGISSEYLARCLMGEPHQPVQYPRDPSDFGRCIRMLDAIPEAAARFAEIVPTMPAPWPQLAEKWADFSALYTLELPTGNGQRLYSEMQNLYKQALS